MKVVAYADDSAILVSKMYSSAPDAIYYQTRVTKIHLPRLHEQKLSLSSNGKHLDVILNTKLNWKLNIELQDKVSIACKSLFGTSRTRCSRMDFGMHIR